MQKLSTLADSLVGSEIVKLGNDISARIRNGARIFNYTIGDFSPAIFPIPEALEQAIITAYQQGATNYPPADGIPELRIALSRFLEDQEAIRYQPDEIQISSGGRPLIYAAFKTLVDPGDKVIYPVPSWNNNHYAHLNGGQKVELLTTPETHFMPTAAALEAVIQDAAVLCLCSPQNPTGTMLEKSELEKICDLVLAENKRRAPEAKKLYLLYDQMYWMLTYGDNEHVHPVALRPEMKEYTLTIDGASKAFAATGIRVGWAMGPAAVIAKMKALLSHIGAWAPMAEQQATAVFLNQRAEVDRYLKGFKAKLEERLWKIYRGFESLKTKGFPVDAIAPQAAIYLTVKIDLKGKAHGDRVLDAQEDVTRYLLDEAALALVPFHCFGGDTGSPWYRISVGTCSLEDIDTMFQQLEKALTQLQ